MIEQNELDVILDIPTLENKVDSAELRRQAEITAQQAKDFAEETRETIANAAAAENRRYKEQTNKTTRLWLGVLGLIILLLIMALTASIAFAQSQPVTPADTIHPNIHQNNGAGQNANPNNANDGGGNMHGIANNPGQSGTNPNDDGVAGFRNQLNNVHGGILDITGNAGAEEKSKVKAGGKQEKIIICHYEEIDVLDEDGNATQDDDGETITEIVTEIIRIPAKAAAKHIENHGDFEIVQGDAEGMDACIESLVAE